MVNYKNIINIGIILFLILNVLNNIAGILSDGLYYKGLLLIEFILFFVAFVLLEGQLKGNRIQWGILFIVLTMQVLGYYFNSLLEKYNCFDLHRLAAFVCMLWVLWIVPGYVYIDSKYFTRLLHFLLIVGIIACLYNLLINWNTIKSFDLKIIMNYTSKYKSFFNTRSNFCLLLCINCVISLYLFETKKIKLVYLFLYFFFFANIILTNARTSIIVMICVTGIYMFQNKVRRIYIFLLVSVLLFVLPWSQMMEFFSEFRSKYYLLFERHTGADLSNGRFELWASAWKGTNIVSFFIGHGVGAKDTYLSYINSSVLSFHNMWVDLFFEGGLFFTGLYIYIISNVVKNIKISKIAIPQKHLFYNFFVVLLISGMGDAIGSLFLLDTFSIVTTLLFVTCPLCLANEDYFCRRFNK